METYVDPRRLPATIWDQGKKVLHLPSALAVAYETLLNMHGLRTLAQSRTVEDSPVGGVDKAATDAHFAQQFDNSAARAQLAICNATEQVARASNALITTLSGNSVCITDAPSGAGAASISFLATIAELRRHEILPRLPLNIQIIGAEISEFARQYAAQTLAELKPHFESQAIFVDAQFQSWDVTDSISNTDLIQNMIRSAPSGSKKLLVVANFSGFLASSGNQKVAEPQLAELFRHASGADSLAIWIEPQISKAVSEQGLFATINRWVAARWHRFARINTDGEDAQGFLTTSVNFKSTLTPERLRPVRLAVMRLDLVRTP